MVLSKLLENVTVRKMFQTLYGRMIVTHDVEVSAVVCDSRLIRRGDMFVAVRGSGADGHAFAHDAINGGAKVVVLEDDAAVEDSFCMHTGTVKVVVPDSRVALAEIAASYYGRPGDALTLVGVTGTNGKTTTSSLIHAMLTRHTGSSGLIGTIEYRIGDRTFPATHTTPGPLELNAFLAKAAEAGCSSAVMEVSSHALDQRRVHGLGFHTAVFTNLTVDHLDYHVTMEAYFEAKKTLFTGLSPDSWAVINTDDGWGKRLAAVSKGKVLSYGLEPDAALLATEIVPRPDGTDFSLSYRGGSARVSTALVGKFNVSNILAAAGTGLSLGIPFDSLAADIASFRPVRGRFEPITSPAGWTVIVDYAHTPDALRQTLLALKEAFPKREGGRILAVFGCGGNRDTSKRPLMGEIASGLADVTIITSDNPRDEEPEAIIDAIAAGAVPGAEVHREADRAKAIRMALSMARRGDVVLIAGKGHEEYQVIGKNRIPFSDSRVAGDVIRGMK